MGRLAASAQTANQVSGDSPTVGSANVMAMQRAVTLKRAPAMSAETTQLDSCVRGEKQYTDYINETKSM